MNSSRRLKELDILRALAFIFVVEQHSMGGYYNIKGISNLYYEIFKFFYTLAKPAVACFLCISAISLCYSYSENFNYKKYYMKRITGVLIPYTVWSMTYIYINKKYTNPTDLLLQILSGNACYHLWYMGMIIRLFIYFPIILLIAKKIHKQKFIFRILVFIMLILSYYGISKYQNVISNNFISFLFTNPTKLQSKFVNITPLFWYLYFVIGIYMALNYKTFKEKILKFKVPVLFFYLALFIYSYLNEMKFIKFNRVLSLSYFVFSILAWYIISVKLSNSIKLYSFFNFISKYSFGGYLCHILVIGHVVNKVRWMFKLKDWLAVGLITWIASSILSPCLIKLINLVPYTKFITGVKHKKLISNYNVFEKVSFINKS